MAKRMTGGVMAARPRLPALSGVRIFAAVHIYLFHIKQAHDAGLLRFPVFSSLPGPLVRLMSRGYVSTGLFFELSGFLLAYAYLDSSGRLKSTDRAFWKGRFLRLYPLYLLSLLLLVPAPALLPFTAKQPTLLEAAGGIATSLTLTQAWFPAFALWWNAPAWALSAFAMFYLVFPTAGRWTASMDRRGLLRLAILLAMLSWLPPGLYLWLDPAGDAWTVSSITLGGTWLNVLRFSPLSWLPQFLAGLALGRWFGLGVDYGKIRPGVGPSRLPTRGDLAVLGLAILLALTPTIPYVPLRHGLLAPHLLVVIDDLARGRGLVASVLARRPFGRLSEASFALFALQMPAGLWYCIVVLSSSQGTTKQFLGMITWTLGVSVLWSELSRRRFLKREVAAMPPGDLHVSGSQRSAPTTRQVAFHRTMVSEGGDRLPGSSSLS